MHLTANPPGDFPTRWEEINMFSRFKMKSDANQLQESSTSFDLEHLEPFLQRVAKLIPQGFTQTEVSQVIGMAKAMACHHR
jgi:hypothetical protein